MKKLIFILLAVVLVFTFTSCTRVTTGPDVSGDWSVSAIVAGMVLNFDMSVDQEGLFFDATCSDFEISEGAVSTNGMVRFALGIEGRLYYFYGNVDGDYMDGFTRKGIAGDVNGNWSAVR